MPLPQLRSKKPGKEVTPAPTPKPPARRANQTASAAVLDDLAVGWRDFKFGNQAWQIEGWRHYDICGELKSPARAIASMVSRAIVHIVEIDEDGRPGKPVSDAKYREMSKQMLGGPDERPELLYLAALNIWLVGEEYTYVESPKGQEQDRWMVLSNTQIKKSGADPLLEFDRPLKHGGGKIQYWLPEGKDKGKDKQRTSSNTGLLIRTWTPHAQLPDLADSSVRSVISVLNLIEQYNKRSSAQNDSRLAGAGVLFMPDDFDFPRSDDEPDESPEDAFEAKLGDVMGRTLRDHANARSLVPIMVSVAAENIDKIKWLTFETPLDEQTMPRLDQCIRRLALGLDMPPELLMGTGDLNHWNAWMSEASTHKAFVAPILARICHGLTEGWLQRVDPSATNRYMVWFDMAPLTVQPNRQQDGLAMWDRGLINDEAARKAGNWSEDDAHTAESYARWIVGRAVLANPQLLSQPDVAAALGIKPIKIELEQPGLPPGGGGGPAAIEAQPRGAGAQEAPNGGTPPAQATSTADTQTASLGLGGLGLPPALFAAAEMAALHSLAVAGKKMLTRRTRDELMGQFAGRTHELHTRLQVDDMDHARNLLAGTFDLIPALAARTGVHWQILMDAIEFYAAGRMIIGEPHDPLELAFYLRQAIDGSGHRHCEPGACRNMLNHQQCAVQLESVPG